MQVVARLHPVQGHQYLTGYNVYVKMTPLCVQWMEKDKGPKLSVFQRLKEIASLNPLSSPKLSGKETIRLITCINKELSVQSPG